MISHRRYLISAISHIGDISCWRLPTACRLQGVEAFDSALVKHTFPAGLISLFIHYKEMPVYLSILKILPKNDEI